jgi:hypothetical protein
LSGSAHTLNFSACATIVITLNAAPKIAEDIFIMNPQDRTNKKALTNELARALELTK